MATLRDPLMRFKPGIPYEIRYGLIEGDVLFLIMYWWWVVWRSFTMTSLIIACGLPIAFDPSLLLPVLFIFDIPSCFLICPSTLFYLGATVPFNIRRQFWGIERRDRSLDQARDQTLSEERQYMPNDYVNWMTQERTYMTCTFTRCPGCWQPPLQRPFSDICSPSAVANPQPFHSLSIPRPHLVTLILHVNLPTSILVGLISCYLRFAFSSISRHNGVVSQPAFVAVIG